MTLDKARRGVEVRIISLPQDEIRSQLVRLGLSEGSTVECLARLPLGPVVLRCKRQEIALGRALARRIHVE